MPAASTSFPNTHMTNNIRLALWAALAIVLFLNYQAWMNDYGPRPDLSTATPTSRGPRNSGGATDLADQIPQATPQPVAPQTKQPPAPTVENTVPGATSVAQAPADQAGDTEGGEVVHVRTDVLDLGISTRGGTIQRADLLKYHSAKDDPTPFRLENLNPSDPSTLYELQSGLTGPQATPTHLALYTAPQTSFDLGNSDELRVPLTWTHDGITVTKTFVLRRGQYRIDVEYAVQNHSDMTWQAQQYAQIVRNDPRTKSSMFNYSAEKSQFHGPAIYNGTKYRKLDFSAGSEDSHLSVPVANGWIAALQHHFVSVIVPPKDQEFRMTLSAAGDQYRLAALGPVEAVPAGASKTLGETLYIGPKLQAQLEAAGPRLELVADYGVLTFLAKPLFWLLSALHSLLGNWGLAIVLATFVLKLIFYPLSEASGRSMAKMKVLQPRLKNLQETYKDDREKLAKATMELYQREKINPVAGCLPMIIQIPVFLAFYWVLLESVEMRQAPFFGWIQDLSARDPYFILPAIMAAAMFAQYKINPPASPDPTQAKVMMFVPLIMSVTLAFFPAGLVVYWTTNTLLTILQQWNINRRIAAATQAKRA
jgi:YidC/Oxa1 family membrane protein insertase